MKHKIIVRAAVLMAAAAMLVSVCAGCVTLGDRNPTATITFSTGDSITIRLYYDKAPNTVKNFISLAESGFYDGTIIHRVVKYSFVQMGDPNGDGTGDAGYYIKGECANNGYKKNDLTHSEGMVSMARMSEDYDSGSCQFFIMVGTKTTYDGEYAVFGKVIDNYDFIEELSKCDVDDNKRPLDEVSIESVTIEKYGRSFGEPSTIKKKD